MNPSRTKYVEWQIRLVFFVMVLALSFAWTTNAAHADTTQGQISIAANGQVIAKGAIVTSISGDVIKARTGWGAMSFNWTIVTGGSTRFVPDATSTEALKAIRIGDTISFSGNLDDSAYTPTVIASVVRDTDRQVESVTEIGALLSVDTEAQQFVVSTRTGTTTVSVNSGTIITFDGNEASLSDMQVGVDVQIMGSLNTTSNTMTAQRVSWKTPSQSVAPARAGIISGFFSWLLGTHGALSSIVR